MSGDSSVFKWFLSHRGEVFSCPGVLSGYSLPYFETLTLLLVLGPSPLLMSHLSLSPDSQFCPPVPHYPHASNSRHLSCRVPKCFVQRLL